MNIPKGFVLVPVEPTEDMLLAGYKTVHPDQLLVCAYKAMITSSPEATQPSDYDDIERYDLCEFGSGLVCRENGFVVGSDNFDRVASERDAALAREAALREELARFKRDAEQDTTIDERDRYHEMADSLALAISQHFRVEIGEHSSMNCPWSVALEVMNGAYITDTDEGRERDALQQRLTAAEKRATEFEGLLHMSKELLTTISRHAATTKPNDWCDSFKAEVADRIEKIGIALKPVDEEGS